MINKTQAVVFQQQNHNGKAAIWYQDAIEILSCGGTGLGSFLAGLIIY